MYTIDAYYQGTTIPEEKKGIAFMVAIDGYKVEEKGLYMIPREQVKDIQRKRFPIEADLIAIVIHGVGESSDKLTR